MTAAAAAVLLALAALPGRDQAAAGLFVAGLLALGARRPGLRRWAALGSAAALGMCRFAPTAIGAAHAGEILAGRAGLAVFAVLLLPGAFREARFRALRLAAVLPPLGCLASWLLPAARMTTGSSATFTRMTVAFGLALFLQAIWTRARASEALALACLASCFFPGWRTLAVVCLEGWMLLRTDTPDVPARWKAAAAPLSCLAVLFVLNGGYGFSHIDLTLISLGDDDPMHPSVAWGTTTVVLSYAVSLVLALRLAVRNAGGAASAHVTWALSSFVLFTGADLLWLGGVRPGVLLTLQFEEQTVFDIVLAGILLGLLLPASIRDHWAARPTEEKREGPAPGSS